MAKTYDRVDRNYLDSMMRMLGFYDKWVEIVKRCVLSVSYSVVLNGKRGS